MGLNWGKSCATWCVILLVEACKGEAQVASQDGPPRAEPDGGDAATEENDTVNTATSDTETGDNRNQDSAAPGAGTVTAETAANIDASDQTRAGIDSDGQGEGDAGSSAHTDEGSSTASNGETSRIVGESAENVDSADGFHDNDSTNTFDASDGVSWPGDETDPGTAIATPLARGCSLSRVPPWWTNSEHTRVLGLCDFTKLSAIPLDGSAPITIAELSAPIILPEYSDVTLLDANAERVVFLESTFLRSAPVNGGSVLTLASDVQQAGVSPDGAHVVYVAPQAGSGELAFYSVESLGGAPVMLSPTIDWRYWVSSSDEASWWFTADSQAVWFENGGGLLTVASLGGGHVRELSGTPNDLKKVWSSDGRTIAFDMYSDALGPVARVLSADSDVPFDLPLPEGVSVGELSISLSGEFVWLIGGRADKTVLMATQATGADWTELASYDDLASLGTVGTADDSILFVGKNGESSPSLLQAPLSGGPSRTLGTLSSLCEFAYLADDLAVSITPDRTKLPFIDNAGALNLADFDLGASKMVVSNAASLRKADLCRSDTIMSPDAEMIAVVSCPLADCHAAVVDLSGELVAADLGAGNVGYSFSPDSTLLEHHNLYGVRVLSIEDNEIKYTYSDGGGNIRPSIWLDGRRIVVPVEFESREQIVAVD